MARVKTDVERKAEDNLKAACARLVVSHGFFAGSVLRKKWICSKSLPMPTIGTDGRDLFYDADYIASKTVPEVMALLVHEACHDLGLHPFRRGTRHPIGWNIACFPKGTWTGFGAPIEQVATMQREYAGQLVCINSQGPRADATPEHPILIRRRLNNSRYPIKLEEPEWVDAGDVRVGDYVCAPKIETKRCDTEIDLREYIRKGTDSKGRHTFGNRAVKSIPLNADTAWLIGAYVAEGSGRLLSFAVGAHETAFQQRLLSVLKGVGISATVKDNSGGSCTIASGNTVFARWLHEHCGRGARNKHIPRVILEHADVNIRRAFLTGLVQGDGTVWRKRLTLGVSSERLVFDTMLLLAQDGIGGARYSAERGPRRLRDKVLPPQTLHFFNWAMKQEWHTRTMLGRTIKSSNTRWKTDEHGVWYRIRGVSRRDFVGTVYNMSTPSHTYIAGGALVHNCDHVVNHIVGEVGLTLPPNGVPPVADTTPEALYEDIMKKAKKLKCNCNLVPPTDEQGNPLSGAALAAAEADAKLQAATTAELARRAGKLPGGLARLVGAALEERVPWEAIVQRFVAQSSKLDSSWRKPNRRYLSRGIVLPSLWSPDVPDFVLACDTSGSIDEKTLRTVCGEVLHALATCEKRGAIRLQIVWCDTEVSAQTVEAASELEPRGGGGTMYSPVFEWVNENNAQTKGVVYVTDGYCSDFGEEPSYPCLWILTAPNDGFHPPWGEIAYIL